MMSIEKGKEQGALSAELIEMLSMHCVPVMPAPDRRDAMRDNILARIHAAPKALITVKSTEGIWTEIAPGVYRKHLLSKDHAHAALYRMLAGSTYPSHDHLSDEECVCLQGEVSLGGITINAGEFHLAPQGVPHGVISTATGCLLYIRTGGRCELA